jgi:hypothetical protein
MSRHPQAVRADGLSNPSLDNHTRQAQPPGLSQRGVTVDHEDLQVWL